MKKTGKLKLTKETARVLTAPELANALGGAGSGSCHGTDCCPTALGQSGCWPDPKLGIVGLLVLCLCLALGGCVAADEIGTQQHNAETSAPITLLQSPDLPAEEQCYCDGMLSCCYSCTENGCWGTGCTVSSVCQTIAWCEARGGTWTGRGCLFGSN